MTKRKTPPASVHPHTLSDILAGYELTVNARGLSEHTKADYWNTFSRFKTYLAETGAGLDPIFTTIERERIEGFLASLPVSKKTRLNYHTGLAALWTWAYNQGYTTEHLLHQIPRPKPEKRAILPYTETDLRAMLQAISTSRPYNNRGTLSSHTLPHQDRNRAIILLLVDTGIRADELCGLTVRNTDTRNERIKIFGKGDKERIVPISTRTAQAILRYWTGSRPGRDLDEPAFTTEGGTALDRHQLRKLIVHIGQRAGVAMPDVHRFRHTFAIAYLRNGGDVYTLQANLGHATMEMCRRYLLLAQSDAQAAHKRASTVANMRL